MLQRIEITCGDGPHAYQVTLTGENLRSVFENACLQDKEGEARVRAIVELGGVSKIERRKEGRYNDGPQNEPALLVFNDNGTPRAIRHFKNGELNDIANGEPAVLQYDHSGSKLVYAVHFDNGREIKKLTQPEMDAYAARLNKAHTIRRARTPSPPKT